MLPDLTIMGKVIGGGLPAAAYGGPPRPDGADRARRRRLPGGDAVGEPARGRRGAGDAASCSTRPPTRGWRATTEALADGPARGAAARDRRPVQVAERAGAADGVLLRPSRSATTRTPPPATRRLRRLVPGAAGARRLPARLPVRGLVPVAGPHRRATSSARSRRPPRRSRRWTAMSARDARTRSEAVARAAERCWPTRPSAPPPRQAAPVPPQLAAAGPRAARAEAEYELLLEMILEGYRLHYGAPRVVAHRRSRPRAAARRPALRARAWPGWPRSATSRRWPSSPT